MAKLSEDLKDISKKKGGRVFATLVILMLIAWWGVRACLGGGILANHIFQIGRNPNWYPLDLLGKEKYMVAFTDDLFAEIAKRKSLRFVITNTGHEGLFSGLASGRYDGIMSSLTPNRINESRFAFSVPFYMIGPVLVVHEDSNIKSFMDLNGETVGVRSGSPLSFNDSAFPNISFSSYSNIQRALDDLELKKIDGVIMDSMLAYFYVKGPYAGELKIVGTPLTTEGIRLITDNTIRGRHLIADFDAALEEMFADGSFQALLEKWSLFNTVDLSSKKEAELLQKGASEASPSES